MEERSVEHFVSGEFRSHVRFLPPEKYAVIRDTTVRACVDTLIINQRGEILLGKRAIYPWPSWWSFGGRMLPGESPAEAVGRTVKEDLGLSNIPPERFFFLAPCSLVFGRRQEPPQENGCHDLVLFHLFPVNNEEARLINTEKVRKGEYEKVKWFRPEEIFSDPGFHPALVGMVKKAMQSFSL